MRALTSPAAPMLQRIRRCLGLPGGLLPLMMTALAAQPASAAVLTVDLAVDENDSACLPGDCSLREALAEAVDGDEVVFALPGGGPWTIRLQSGAGLGALVIDIGVTITGPGADLLAISGDSTGDGTGDLRPIVVTASGAPVVRDLTVRDGRLTSSADRDGGCVLANGDSYFGAVRFENCRAWAAEATTTGIPGGHGGAIYVPSGAALVVEDTAFVANLAGTGGGTPDGTSQFAGGDGGAIATNGALTVVRRSTFSGNRAGTGGPTAGPGGRGGAIAALAGITWIDDSTFEGNASGDGGRFQNFPTQGPDGVGGAIYVAADATLNNSTVSGNTIGSTSNGTSAGGGGLAVAAGTARLRNVTVTANGSSAAGGGIVRSGGTLELGNTLVAGNLASGSNNEDCSGALVSLGFNLVGVANGCAGSLQGSDQSGTAGSPLDPLLAPLGDQGGPTATHALLSGSPAIDAGNPAGCLGWDAQGSTDFPFTADQRGEPRPTDGDGDSIATCDAGSFEAPVFVPTDWSLAVAVAGPGEVTSAPAGIDCPGDCSEDYSHGTDVALTATPDADAIFTGWTGACSGTGSCVVSMTADRSVGATFVALHTLTVTLAGSGTGTVESSPGGIDCPGDCEQQYTDGTDVSLTATPVAGSVFEGWSGACTDSAGCLVEMTEDRAVTATFLVLRSLTVTVVGSGEVTSVPLGIDCPADCDEDYADGTAVTLTANPDPGFQFTGWTGACAGTGSCPLTMTQNLAATATFEPIVVPHTLTVTVTGPGTVTSSPAGISCPGDCEAEFSEGTVVDLAALPGPGAHLVGWSGDCSGSGACQITLTQDREVAAAFDTVPFLDGFESGDTSAWSTASP